MSTSLIEIIKSGTPAPKIVLLPDSCFFVRGVPLADAGAGIPEQVELALEALSPFPVQQLLHGHYVVGAAGQALAFAAYRRRFSADDVDAWVRADWVAPTFCSLLGYQAAAGTTLMYASAEAMTAVHWDAAGFPSRVVVRVLGESADEAHKAEVRSALLNEVGGTLQLIELEGVPEPVASPSEQRFVFKVGSLETQVSTEQALAMDVRPKEDLAGLVKSRRRSLLLWRSLAGLAACVALLSVGELALFGARFFHKANQTRAEGQRPLVSKIMTSQSLAFRIDELATRRLLPFEMITVLAEKKPRSIQFLRSSTTGLNGIRVEASTANSADIASYQAVLAANPTVASAEVSDLSSRDRTTRFTLQVSFKPGALVASSQ